MKWREGRGKFFSEVEGKEREEPNEEEAKERRDE